MLKVAIIGAGTIAPIHKHAISISENAELVCVCDTDESTFSMFEGVKTYTDIDEMLEKETLDCVHICLPHYMHVDVAIKCAKKGIHVFTEKPVALTYEEATKLFTIEEDYNVKVGVCLQNRYNTTSVKLKEIFDSSDKSKFLGTKGIVTWHRNSDYYKKAPWRGKMALAGGGAVINQSVHTLDLLSFIAGEFKTVESKVANFSLKETEIEDSVMARMKYKDSDASSIFFATIGFCSNSSVKIDLVYEDVTYKMADSKLYKQDMKTGEETLLCEDQKLPGSKHYYGASHFIAIDSFYKAIINNTNEYVSVKEAAYPIKVLDNIRLSDELRKEMEI